MTAAATLRDRQSDPAAAVIIAGGGIGGLAAALALAKRGITSEVLERRPEFGEDGAGIQIGPNGTRILEQIGAAAFLRAKVAEPDAIAVRDAVTSRPLARFPLGSWIAHRHGAPYWTVHRRDLHASLLAAAQCQPQIVIRTGVEVAEVRDEGRAIAAKATNGENFRGPALVVADGAWSVLRGGAFAGGLPLYAGKTAVRTVIPAAGVPDELRSNEVGLWLGPNIHVVHYPVNAGQAMALVAIFDDRSFAVDWTEPCDPAWVAVRTASFAPLLRALLAVPQDWRRWSLITLTRPPRMAAGRMALLGDSAHPVLPFMAQGGVMALEDAATLARELAADPESPARAFQHYADARKPRVRRVARASAANGRIYHLRGPMAAARNLALAKLPAERFMRRYDWLYGWRLPPEDA